MVVGRQRLNQVPIEALVDSCEVPDRLEYVVEMWAVLGVDRANGYSQRWMAETSYSTTKRSPSDAVGAPDRYRQFREPVLTSLAAT